MTKRATKAFRSERCRAPGAEGMAIIDLIDEEDAAVTAAVRRLIEDDKFPLPRSAALGAGEAGTPVANPGKRVR